MHTYKLHIDGETSTIKEHRTDGRIREVQEDNVGLLNYIADGNELEEVIEVAAVPTVEQKIARLWYSAQRYVSDRLDPAGQLYCYSRAAASDAHAVDNLTWVKNIWAEYYTRKAVILEGGEANYDWSSFGNLPHGCDVIMQNDLSM